MKTHDYGMPRLPAVAGVLVLAVLFAAFIGVQQAAAAQVNGAIFTSVCDGSKVNANLYDDRRDVYLNGGPQPPACNQAAGLSPDGDYYFQVTDPSGASLLSTDPLKCRVVTVTDGVIVAYHPDASCLAGVSDGCAVRSDGPHNLGTGPCVGDLPNEVSVQLFPFDVTPNNGGVYKAWVMPVVDLPAGCDASQVDPRNCEGSVHGFVDADSKTDNFRVKEENPPAETGEIDVFKFCDANANGILDPAELLLGLQNWQITFTPDPNSCSGLTDSNGLLACANVGAGTYSIAETVQAGFKHTATCVDGSCGTGACSLTVADVCTSDADCPSGETCIVPPPAADFTSIAVAGGDTHNVDFGNVGLSTISGRKFDDRNADGVDNSEAGIAGVKVLLTGTAANGTPVSLCTVTATDGSYSFPDLLPGTYTVSEVKPAGTIATTPTSCQEQLTPDAACAGTTKTCDFGNACLGAGGGLTLGFWSNKNGQALFFADDLAAMVALNLRNANGTAFDPTSYSQFRTWLLNANATNMAYMLSAQLAAMKLNTINGSPFVSPSATVFAGTAPAGCSVPGLSTLGFITIGDLIAAADTASNHSLATDANTTAAGAARTCQEFMKNALDRANNNLNFVVACPTNFGAICQ